jgi:hypothetical protein
MGTTTLTPIKELAKVVTAPIPAWPVMDEAIIQNVMKVLKTESL